MLFPSVAPKVKIQKPIMSEADVFGPLSLSPTALYAKMQAYQQDVLNLAGPINRWLTSSHWSPWIVFLCDYVFLPNILSLHMVCVVRVVCKTVSNHFSELYS